MTQLSLEVFVESGCYSYRRSLDLAEYVRKAYPEVTVSIVDVSREQGAANRDLVIATPTFVLNGARFSLGNPSLASLEDTIQDLLRRAQRDSVA
ncbi:MAG: hypothetical protein ACRD1T_26335 [Acidimicrobiia bacterium]